MKDRSDAILQSAQAAFLERLLPEREPVLAEMERAAETGGIESGSIPISDPEVGCLLTILTRSIGARRVVEVGTAIGYGALCLARGGEQVEVVSIEADEGRLGSARRYLERAGVADRVRLELGTALDVLRRLQGPFDLAYLDAVKTEYRDYVEILLPKMRPGGLIVADNTLWKGWVADPPPEAARDQNTEALREFDRYLMAHPLLTSLVLPLGDGVAIACVG
ncbi:MAG: O-methyltransferase [Thermoanaerobaculia bacterium]|nr:O-methyltransferase [Thermoanaerobaculia bacterium]